MAHSQISQLVSLITNASKVVEQHFAQSTYPAVPSLDDTEPHPLDSEIHDKDLRIAIETIESACLQLSATVGRPDHTIANRWLGGFEPSCMDVALKCRFADILLDKPMGMHVSEIGQKSGVEERKAGRVLRLLASNYIFREVSEDVFANNRLSMQLASHNPLSNLGHFYTTACMKASVVLSDTLTDPEWGHSYAANHTPFNKQSGYPDRFFNYIEEVSKKPAPEAMALGPRFAAAMVAWSTATDSNAVIHGFPWKDLDDGASVCDVGGGLGNITVQLAKAYPTLQLILQDQPDRILLAKNEFWPKECPEALEEKRIAFEPIDFLHEPPVRGCHVYYLKNITHNWPDVDCIKILRCVREAMAPHSRVLIHDYVLQQASRIPDELSSFKQAPEPLLANYGAARILRYNLDMLMLTMFNGQQRRVECFRRLGEAAGLQFEKLWDLGEMGLVEYRLPA